MSKIHFLVNGGNYKLGIDDGRIRVPLNDQEAERVFTDPELLSETGTTTGAELNMKHHSDLFCDLQAGDEIIFGLFADSAIYRGIWVHAFNKVKGFVADFDLVSVKDVYEASLSGSPIGVPMYVGTQHATMDFTNGVGNATCDAVQMAGVFGSDHSKFRNKHGQVVKMFEPVHASLGDSLYMRMTIVEVGSLGQSGTSSCASCGKAAYPLFKAGVVFDAIAVDKQRVTETVCQIGVNCKTQCCPDKE